MLTPVQGGPLRIEQRHALSRGAAGNRERERRASTERAAEHHLLGAFGEEWQEPQLAAAFVEEVVAHNGEVAGVALKHRLARVPVHAAARSPAMPAAIRARKAADDRASTTKCTRFSVGSLLVTACGLRWSR